MVDLLGCIRILLSSRILLRFKHINFGLFFLKKKYYYCIINHCSIRNDLDTYLDYWDHIKTFYFFIDQLQTVLDLESGMAQRPNYSTRR